MGYSTTFIGSFTLSRSLTIAELRQIEALSKGDFPFNSGYCDWEVTEDGAGLAHNGSEKSYDYTDSIRHLCAKVFAPMGVLVNGEVKWEGEENGDMGLIVVEDNVVTTKRAKITFE